MQVRPSSVSRSAVPFPEVLVEPLRVGRTRLVETLLRERWETLVHVDVRSPSLLNELHAERPWAHYGGVEVPSRASVREACAFAELREGHHREVIQLAEPEDVDFSAFFAGRPPERIVFFYSLSTFEDAEGAVDNARRQVAADGEVLVVDFGSLRFVPGPMREAVFDALDAFRFRPLPASITQDRRARVLEGPLGSYRMVRLPPARWRSPLRLVKR